MLVTLRIALLAGLLLTMACDPCYGKSGTELEMCEQEEAKASGELDEDPITFEAGEWVTARIQESDDVDRFPFTGADGSGSVLIEVEHTDGGADTELEVTIASSWNNRERADPLEDFVVKAGELGSLQFGSFPGRPFRVEVKGTGGSSEYRVRATFKDERYETEQYMAEVIDEGDLFGRLKDGTDREEFRFYGIDGSHSATLMVEHLGSGPEDSEIVVQLGSSTKTNTSIVIESEGFSVGFGETASLTIGTEVEAHHFVNLVTDAGPVPYRINLAFGEDSFEREGAVFSLEAGEPFQGRLRTGADTDQMSLAGQDGSEMATFILEHLEGGNAESEITMTIEGSDIVVPAGEMQSTTISLTLGSTADITLAANEGPAPYRVTASFD